LFFLWQSHAPSMNWGVTVDEAPPDTPTAWNPSAPGASTTWTSSWPNYVWPYGVWGVKVEYEDAPGDASDNPRRRLRRKTSFGSMSNFEGDPRESAGSAEQAHCRKIGQEVAKGEVKEYEGAGIKQEAEASRWCQLRSGGQEEVLGSSEEMPAEMMNGPTVGMKGKGLTQLQDGSLERIVDAVARGTVKHEMRTPRVDGKAEDKEVSGGSGDEMPAEIMNGLMAGMKGKMLADLREGSMERIVDAVARGIIKQQATGSFAHGEEDVEGAAKSQPTHQVKHDVAGKPEAEAIAFRAKRRLQYNRTSVKREVKCEPCVEEPIAPFATRLPLFIAQCQAFQLAKKTWLPTRPCCLANRFIRPLAPPEQGESCYQRLNDKQRNTFRDYVEGVEAHGRIQSRRGNRYFLTLLHPEQLPKLPWMDVRWWISHGWILTAEGPKQPAESSGSSSQGRKPTEAAPSEPTKEKRRTITVLRKRSGVPGVSWHRRHNAWEVRWKEAKARRHHRAPEWRADRHMYFYVHKYMKPGKSVEVADMAALRDAVAYRRDLIKKGKITVTRRSANASGFKGVFWCTSTKSWAAHVTLSGKRIIGGRFRPRRNTPEGMEDARLAAMECRRKMEARYFKVNMKEAESVGFCQKRESGVEGVSWHKCFLCWVVQMHADGKGRRKLFHPEEHTNEKIEKARLEAAKCRKEWELQREREQLEAQAL